MTLYKYRTVDRDGKVVEGTMEEVSARHAASTLRERGLQVNAIEEVGKGPGFVRMKSRLTWDDLDLFNRELLAITKSGLPLAPSLKALAQDIRSKRLRPVLEDVRVQVESGSSLEEAISRHPGSFPRMYASVIRAGERTGNLSGVLSHLSAYSARMVEMKNSIQEAVAYPILVLVAACVFLGFILVKVVPVFGEMYQDFGATLPAPTQFWVDLSNFFVNHTAASIAIVLGGLIAAYLILKHLLRTESGGNAVDWVKLKIPVFGPLYYTASMARFSRHLALLLASEVPVVESLDLASAAAGNAVLRMAVMDAARLVEGGEAISNALASTGYFGHSFCWMVGSGEERGEVAMSLLNLADTYDRGADRMDKLISMLIGPVVIILLGMTVGFIVISLYLPIFMLGDAISGV